MNIRLFLIACVFVGSVGVGAVAAQDEPTIAPPLTIEEKLYGFSNFWKEVTYNFAHWDDVADLDWDAAYKEFLPRIMATESNFEYYQEMMRFSALLKDGHTNVYFPEGLLKQNVGKLPLLLKEIGHRAIVSNVDVKYSEQIPVGSEILKVDGRTIEDLVENDIIPLISTSAPHIYWDQAIRAGWEVGKGVLYGPKGSMALLSIQTPSGEKYDVKVPRDRYVREIVWVKATKEQPLSEFKQLDNGIAYMALNSFGNKKIVTDFEDKLPEFHNARAIIIDLRNNGGGSGMNALSILRHFTDQPIKMPKWKTPKHFGAYKAWGKFSKRHKELEKYSDYYFGHAYHVKEAVDEMPSDGAKLKVPTIVLLGRSTGSAAEDFLVYGDEVEHMRYVGEPSYGSTGQPLLLDMPGGGRARVSTKRAFYADGREFIGVGVLPDILVQETVEDVRRGNDPVLNKAIELLNISLAKSKGTLK